jgi:predicted TIM-barrel fold metal-dependent hydrolase
MVPYYSSGVTMPTGVDVLDSMIWFPTPDPGASKAEYLFRDRVALPAGCDPVDYTLEQMARFGITQAVVDVGMDPVATEAAQRHPERFIPCASVDPNLGMETVRQITRWHDELGLRAVSLAPAMLQPAVPIDDKRMYPVYAKCAELGLPVFITVGVPGPRVPMAPQRVDLLDEVCWFFPELQIVMRHGAEPWEDLAVKLMTKWPNLFYSTSAYAPRKYPQSIVEFANKRGGDQVLFAGYYAAGLTWDRIFSELPDVPLKSDVWPKFLGGNARRVLGLAS